MTDSRQNLAPEHAVTIWFDGDSLCLLLPPSGHVVKIPIDRCEVMNGESAVGWVLDHYFASLEPKNENFTPTTSPLRGQRGWFALLEILRERFRQKRPAGISHPASPTQWNLEVLLKGKPITRIEKIKKKAATDLSLEELGL